MSGGTLTVLPNSNGITNTGVMQASSGGTLSIVGMTNNSGLIEATGAGSIVETNGATINGGNLTTTNGGLIQNSGTATLTAVTITPGSTFQANNGSTTFLTPVAGATLTNQGTIQLSSGGNPTYLTVNGDNGTLNLTGGGVVNLGASGNGVIGGNFGTETLVNVNNTIQGSGNVGNFSLAIVNNGNVLSNVAGGALYVLPNLGGVTNNGVFQANSTSTLVVANLTNYIAATSTLTGGTYNAFSGTIYLEQAYTGSGKVIATNAATILLDGATARIIDPFGSDILRGFLATNTAAGSFTIQDGANLTTAATGFSNSGIVNIGANSAYIVGGSNDYTQAGGTTTLGSSSSVLAVASGHSVDINGGTLQGFGTIQGNLANDGGILMPGVMGAAGVLTVTGDYLDPPSSHLFIQIGGSNTMNGLSQLDVGGTATLNNGTLDVSLINGFVPAYGETFDILNSGSLVSGMFADNWMVVGSVNFEVAYNVNIPNGFAGDVVLTAVPEPSSMVMLAIGIAVLGVYAAPRHQSPSRVERIVIPKSPGISAPSAHGNGERRYV